MRAYRKGRALLVVASNLLATVQVVWFYLCWVSPYLHATMFEQGRERTPFQGRLLMMLPMRWAHQSQLLQALALSFSRRTLWFESGVSPEGILQAVVDVLCVALTGLVARSLYQKSSPSGVLTPTIYPLTLVMIAVTYCLTTDHHLRMVYDFPSLALFAIGLYLIYFRRSILFFLPVFMLATINRETSVILLAFFVLSACCADGDFQPKLAFAPRTLLPLLVLAAFWLAWQHWIGLRFAANPSEAGIRWKHNFYLLLNPLTWPQFLSIGAFTVPTILLYRRQIADPVLRLWLWVLLPWTILMILFGIVIETRVFGELIPYLACCFALIAERLIAEKLNLARLPVSAGYNNKQPSALPSPNAL